LATPAFVSQLYNLRFISCQFVSWFKILWGFRSIDVRHSLYRV